MVQQCKTCEEMRFPPQPVCDRCGSPEQQWRTVSGRGRIWSFIVVHPPILPAFGPLTPFPVVIVELEEGRRLRMTGNLITEPGAAINSVPLADISIGAPVSVSFEDFANNLTMPFWTLDQESDGSADI